MFATWFILKSLKPEVLVESGVWRGQGTWLIENTLPGARIICLEPNPQFIEYRSKAAEYLTRDFSRVDWAGFPQEEVLLFFDDHQNALFRLKNAKKLGFTQMIFEDNYPSNQGDCYSLKQILMQEPGLKHYGRLRNLGLSQYLEKLSVILRPGIEKSNLQFLKENLKVYYEFPPVFKAEFTRWGDRWDDEHYPTEPQLLNTQPTEELAVFTQESDSYNWICYAELK